MNIHAAAAYAAHLLTARSTAGHGVHSPLMFRFITDVIGGRADRNIIEEVRRLRREMLSDRRVVRVTDLGAGSTVMGKKEDSFFRDASALALLTESEEEPGGNTRLAGPVTGPGAVSSDGITPEPFVIERSISMIAAAAALPEREAGLLSRIAASLDSILERVPGQQVCGSHSTSPPAKSRNTTGEPAGDTQVTGQPEKDQPSDDLLEPHSQVNGQPENDLRADHSRDAGQPDNRSIILELGTSLGISTLALALGAPHKRIVTVEGCPELAAIARENLLRHGADNAEVLNMEFSQALSHLKESGIRVEMAFIDGNHRGASLTAYVNTIRRMGDEMIIVADDIRINRDMHVAWQTLPTFSFVTATLKTFRLGMLFCLQNLTPGHYRIRY